MSTVDDDVPCQITDTRGGAWVLISIPPESLTDGGFDVRMEIGEELDVASAATLLGKVLGNL
jgi:hypothetical protein